MNFLQFLNILDNTLEHISVRGREDLERMGGIYSAIDKMKEQCISKGGDDSGRQNNSGADPCNDSK